MEAKGEGCEDCGAVARRLRAEGLLDMFKAAASRHPMAGKESQLCRAVHQPFDRIEPVDCRDLSDRVHSRVDVEGGETFGAALDLSDALADLIPDWPE
jgi:hypothetical protein